MPNSNSDLWWIFSEELGINCWYNPRTSQYLLQDQSSVSATAAHSARIVQRYNNEARSYAQAGPSNYNFGNVQGSADNSEPRRIPNLLSRPRSDSEGQQTTELTSQFQNLDLLQAPRQQPPQADTPSTTGGSIPVLRLGNNQITQVQSVEQVSDRESFTDPALRSQGVIAHKFLKGTPGTTERLDANYRIRPKRFFVVGKVFFTLWAEPVGEGTSTVITSVVPTSSVQYGEKVFSKVRRFIVIREGPESCSALPIFSYGGRGAVGQGAHKLWEHGIVYTSKNAPKPLSNENGMQPNPVRIDPDHPNVDRLTAESRIHYGKIYTIEHNLKVKPLGMVNDRHTDRLLQQFSNVWTEQVGIKRRTRAHLKVKALGEINERSTGPLLQQANHMWGHRVDLEQRPLGQIGSLQTPIRRVAPQRQTGFSPQRQPIRNAGGTPGVPVGLTPRQQQAMLEHGRVTGAQRGNADNVIRNNGLQEDARARSDTNRSPADSPIVRLPASQSQIEPGSAHERRHSTISGIGRGLASATVEAIAEALARTSASDPPASAPIGAQQSLTGQGSTISNTVEPSYVTQTGQARIAEAQRRRAQAHDGRSRGSGLSATALSDEGRETQESSSVRSAAYQSQSEDLRAYYNQAVNSLLRRGATQEQANRFAQDATSRRFARITSVNEATSRQYTTSSTDSRSSSDRSAEDGTAPSERTQPTAIPNRQQREQPMRDQNLPLSGSPDNTDMPSSSAPARAGTTGPNAVNEANSRENTTSSPDSRSRTDSSAEVSTGPSDRTQPTAIPNRQQREQPMRDQNLPLSGSPGNTDMPSSSAPSLAGNTGPDAANEANLVAKGYTAAAAKRIVSLTAGGWWPLDAVAVSNLVDRGTSLAAAVEKVTRAVRQKAPRS